MLTSINNLYTRLSHSHPHTKPSHKPNFSFFPLINQFHPHLPQEVPPLLFLWVLHLSEGHHLHIVPEVLADGPIPVAFLESPVLSNEMSPSSFPGALLFRLLQLVPTTDGTSERTPDIVDVHSFAQSDYGSLLVCSTTRTGNADSATRTVPVPHGGKTKLYVHTRI